MKLMDMTGQRFGKWTVLERAEDDRSPNVTWLCRCACGKEKVVQGSRLRRGGSTRCGSCAAPEREGINA